MTPSPRVTYALTMSLALLTPSLAPAQSPPEDPWGSTVSADHPGFADSSVTLPAGTYQVEIGLEGTKVAGNGPFNAGANVLGRFGLFDGLELRAKVPEVGAALDLEGGATTQLLFERFEAGAKWSLFSGDFSLALIPMLTGPTTLVDSPFLFGGSLGLSADLNLGGGLGLNLYAAPSFAISEAGIGAGTDETEAALGASAAVGLTVALDPQLSIFAEGWANIGSEGVSPAGNTGLVYLINPDILVDAYFGVQLPGGRVTPYGGLGFALLVR